MSTAVASMATTGPLANGAGAGEVPALRNVPLGKAVGAAHVPSLAFSLEYLRGSNEPYRLPTMAPSTFREVVLRAVNKSAAASPVEGKGIIPSIRYVRDGDLSGLASRDGVAKLVPKNSRATDPRLGSPTPAPGHVASL